MNAYREIIKRRRAAVGAMYLSARTQEAACAGAGDYATAAAAKTKQETILLTMQTLGYEFDESRRTFIINREGDAK